MTTPEPALVLRGIPFRPALFCAPLAGVTHSAFRRLVAEFGGCGAFWTEMLAGRQILVENLRQSPYLKRSPLEPKVIYQLMIREGDPIEEIVGRLSEIGPDGIDVNLACHAPMIRRLDAGSRLFENLPVLAEALKTLRRCWPGLLTVKIRLGPEVPDWRPHFEERMKLFEAGGVDAVILHPRFFEDKFKRRARHELLPWAASLTRLPLIANGDIAGPETLREIPALTETACGLMIGRMAVVHPWIFATWDQDPPRPSATPPKEGIQRVRTDDSEPFTPDYAGVWRRLVDYTCEDFPPEKAIGRIKVFTKYYARNFTFGHDFYTSIQNAPTLDAVRERADHFFGRSPAIDTSPSVMGL